MIVNSYKVSILALLLTAGLATTDALAVKLSTEEFKEYAREEAYWVVSVDCEDGSESRTIQRKTDGDQWCSKDLDGYCYDTKVVASDKVCGSAFSVAFTQAIENQQAEERAAREKREQERKRQQAAESERQNKLAIEAELLEIEQSKLSLRRQELELQKRAVEIRDQLKALDEA